MTENNDSNGKLTEQQRNYQMEVEKYRQADTHEVEHIDMPIKAPVVTSNFGDILRYFKYNMGAGLIMATLERMVADAREDMQQSNFGIFVKFIGVGIMIFIILIGAYVFLSNPSIGTGAAASAAPAAPAVHNLVG